MSLLFWIIGQGLHQAARAAGGDGTRPGSPDGWRQVPANAPPETHEQLCQAWQAERGGRRDEALAIYRRGLRCGNVPGWVRQRAAALAVLRGATAEAAARWQEPAAHDAVSGLLLAALLLHQGQDEAAAAQFQSSTRRLLAGQNQDTEMGMHSETIHWQELGGRTTVAENHETAVQKHVTLGEAELRKGHYVRAAEQFDEARKLVDMLLAAHGAWAVAEDGGTGRMPESLGAALVSLARLSDALLRHAARTRLAANLAEALRRRNLRDDLAPWATGNAAVEKLLHAELERLVALAGQRPSHAEVQYRLGLMARVAGDLRQACRALRVVLTIEPNHAEAAARLAATLLELGEPVEAQSVLHAAHRMDAAVLGRYHAVAVAAQDPERFERAVQALEQDVGKARNELRANLAFALGAMGLAGPGYAAWKEPESAAV